MSVPTYIFERIDSVRLQILVSIILREHFLLLIVPQARRVHGRYRQPSRQNSEFRNNDILAEPE
jgi:hypothetical protein